MSSASTLPLLPWPRRIVRRSGSLETQPGRLAARMKGILSDRVDRAVDRLAASLDRGQGARSFPFDIDCGAASNDYPALGDDESYRLEVGHGRVLLTATGEWGVLRAFATIAQLCRPTAQGIAIPHCSIDDAPRFSWRGLMLDPARHFLPAEAIERTLDGMALAKLNVLHLHLSDDQGFRFQSRHYPELAALGGAGQFYSVEEMRGLVEYAADRGIRIVPELDVPGHCTSWLAAHPHWGTRSEPLRPSQRFGVHKACLDPTNPEVYAALEAIFFDLAAVFPDRCIHIGGDEVNPSWWRDSTHVRKFMAEHRFADVADLQAHFNARVNAMLTKLGRALVGWDEIVHPTLEVGSIVQSWRGAASRDRALAAGFDCVFSAGYYLDLFYPADLHYSFDPEATNEGLAAAESALREDRRLRHVKDGLGWATSFNAAAETVDQAAATQGLRRGRVLGGEACVWGELVDARLLNLRTWDRLPAVAERLWSEGSLVDTASMVRRTGTFVAALARNTGIDLDKERRALFASVGLDAAQQRSLAPLLDALEPVKWYARLLGEATLEARIAGRETAVARPYGVDTPLDRIVDFLPAESALARTVTDLVGRVLEGDRSALSARARLLVFAKRWRAQRRSIRRIAKVVPAVAEIEPLSVRLLELGEVVERALRGESTNADRDWFEAALAPRGELMLAVCIPFEPLLASS